MPHIASREYGLKVKLTFIIFMAIVMISILEGGASLYLSKAKRLEPVSARKYAFDEVLGWRLLDGEHLMIHQDFHLSYSVINGKRRTHQNVGPKKGGINFFGDSFTFGIGVQDSQTIESFVAAALPPYEIRNYGVSGYAPDQYFLNYQKQSVASDINVFIILTSNDYHEILSKKTVSSYEKPYLKASPDSKAKYVWRFPVENSSSEKVNGGGDLKAVRKERWYSFQSSFVLLLKQALRRSSVIVGLRNNFVKPDVLLVDEAINRIDYLLGQLDKNSCFFAIVPSYSLMSGISSNTSEGLFAKRLHTLLANHEYKFTDLYADTTLSGSDYWLHEGHPNVQGNKKIAGKVVELLRPYLTQ